MAAAAPTGWDNYETHFHTDIHRGDEFTINSYGIFKIKGGSTKQYENYNICYIDPDKDYKHNIADILINGNYDFSFTLGITDTILIYEAITKQLFKCTRKPDIGSIPFYFKIRADGKIYNKTVHVELPIEKIVGEWKNSIPI
jgi:hypothetical protein